LWSFSKKSPFPQMLWPHLYPSWWPTLCFSQFTQPCRKCTFNALLFATLSVRCFFLVGTWKPLIQSWQINERHMCILGQVLVIRLWVFSQCHTQKESLGHLFTPSLVRMRTLISLKISDSVRSLTLFLGGITELKFSNNL
jgi:hypothetical protein